MREIPDKFSASSKFSGMTLVWLYSIIQKIANSENKPYLYTYKLSRMNGKLTLSIKQQVIETAKAYAKNNGKSLSNIVEAYLKSLSDSNENNKKVELSELVKELKGSVTMPKDFKSYKETLEDALIEKYLK